MKNAQNQKIQRLVNYLFCPCYIPKQILRWKNSCGSHWEDYAF